MKANELSEQQVYDIASVISSLDKVAFFDAPDKETKDLIEANVSILTKLLEANEKLGDEN